MTLPKSLLDSLVPRRRTVILLALLASVAGCWSLARAQSEAIPPPEAVITELQQLWSVGKVPPDQENPLRIRVAVVYYNPQWKNLFLGVGTAVTYFSCPPGPPLPFKAGQVVDLDGFIRLRGGQIVWEKTKITVVKDAAFPSPTRITAFPSEAQELNHRYIEIDGLICEQQEVDSSQLRLNLIALGKTVYVALHLPENVPIPQLNGAYVRVRGIVTVKRDPQDVVSEIALWVADPGAMKTRGWLSEDQRFVQPRTPIEDLSKHPPGSFARVEGIVYRQEPGCLTLRDETGQVKLLTLQTQVVKEGERVEAIGLPGSSGAESLLRGGLFRSFGAALEGTPRRSGVILSRLRLTEQIRELRPEEAALSHPVKIIGAATWISPETHSFFLQDASGGIQVILPEDGSIPMPGYGNGISVTGTTSPGEFTSVVRCTALEMGGQGRTFPEPRVVTFEQAITGGEYARWIEIRGYVRSVTGQGRLVRMDLSTSGGEFMALVPAEKLPPGLEGAVVQLRGVCSAQTNERRQLTGLQVLVPFSNYIQVLEAVPPDLFATPRRSVGSLLQFQAGNTQNRREQVSGVVLLHRPGQFFYLQDGPDCLLVLSRQTDVLKPGDVVDVVGFPGHEGRRLMMREAVYRRTGSAAEPAFVSLSQVEDAAIHLDGRLVQISGTLLNIVPKGAATRLQIQTGHTVFEAEWDAPADAPELQALEKGSIVAVRGVYRVEMDEYGQPRAFTVNLRRPQDLATLRRPSWWTGSRILWVTAGLLTAALLAAAWGILMARTNGLLRQAQLDLRKVNEALEGRVEERTRELAAERDLLHTLLKNSPDQIYFKDRDSRFLRCSQVMAERFQVASPEELIGKSDFDFFDVAHARPAVDDEQTIMRTGEAVVGRIEKEVWKDATKPNSWVLTTKVPMRDKTGEIVGTFGISKDITAIKEAEQQLEQVHRQLVETSRQAGMAEVATSVLHNVGNVLNSVNVSCSLITDAVRKSRIGGVAKAASLLQQHAGDLPGFFARDPASMKLPEFLSKLAQKLASEQAGVIEELGLLGQNIEHIKEIVAMQQNYGKVAGITDVANVIDLVEDSLRMNAGALTRHEVVPVREFTEVPTIIVEKHKVLQILVNLIRNAKYACDATGRTDKKMTLRVGPVADGVHIVVSDNGIGIPKENLTRIFSHGFTTKKEGHGFGLHNAVLCAQEMGGSLSVHSDGPGTGATFTLMLPLAPRSKS